ncbi:MAG: hypothetical protein ETSY2_32135 [Candidatus Entotheonella gemina]|uniref:Soluble ligand binding domain-containing protein n=1 Tax=Candidatus Entotheonella gemina TaxID=1429439 RepID=W4M1Q6_9BACT|nr:MAG: hypothetical protein ETSY2_32135 [Candidatus Entotheonella gemina]
MHKDLYSCYLLILSLLVLLIAGCVREPSQPSDADVIVPDPSPQVSTPVMLSAIEVKSGDSHMQIVLSGSQPFEVEFENHDDPLRLTVHVASAQVRQPQKVKVGRGGIRSVQLQQLPGPEPMARLDIHLDDRAFYRLTKKPERLMIGVQLPEPSKALSAPPTLPQEPYVPPEPDPVKPSEAEAEAASATEPSVPVLPEIQEYRVGSGDELAITVYGEPELTQTYLVTQRGDIAFQFVGAVPVAGLTTDEVAAALRQALSPTYVLDPQVTVEVKTYKSQRVFVVGATSPATFDLQKDTTLIEILSQIEGLESNSHLLVYRRGPETDHGTNTAQGYANDAIRVDLERLLRQGDMSLNFVLQPRDVIYVPTALRKGGELVFVVGAIQPQTFPLKEGMTLIEVLSKLSALENRTHVLVYRRAQQSDNPPADKPGPEEDAIRVDLERLLRQGDMSLNLVLEPRDVIYVPDASQGGVVSNSITVFGEVKRPGPLDLPENGMTILETIAEAGGFAQWAAPKRTRVLRMESGKERTITIDVSAIMRGKLSQNIELKPNDVIVVPERRLF